MENTTRVKKTMLAFDIDHTLSLSKQPIPTEMAELLTQVLERFQVCIMSGRSYTQFLEQVVGELPDQSPELMKRLHLFPAQGTQYYHFDEGWKQVYAFELREDQVSKIFATVETAARELGLWREANPETNDMVLENRLSQVTFAGVDTGATLEVKRAYDPDCAKREALIEACKDLAPEFEYKIGGNTSIDITQTGLDKGFGMKKLMEFLELDKEEILYFGDMTQPEGNDFPIVQLGIDVITVREYDDTEYALRGILGILA